MTNTPPLDGYSIQIAPGIYIPHNRLSELDALLESNPVIAQAVADMHTALTEVAPHIFVERQNVAAWIERMETDMVFVAAMDCLMDRLNHDGLSDTTITLNLTPRAQQLFGHPSAPPAKIVLAYGKAQ